MLAHSTPLHQHIWRFHWLLVVHVVQAPILLQPQGEVQCGQSTVLNTGTPTNYPRRELVWFAEQTQVDPLLVARG